MRILTLIVLIVMGMHLWLSNVQSASHLILQAANVKGTHLLTTKGQSISLYGLWLATGMVDGESYLRQLLTSKMLKFETQKFIEGGAASNRYGDLHGKLMTANGDWIQKKMIMEGQAWWSGAAAYPDSLRIELVEAEKQAEKQARGLWKTFSTIDANMPDPNLGTGQFIVAQGRVKAVYEGSKTTYLNFGDNWRDDFTVGISKHSAKKFVGEGWNLGTLKNKLVRVRGIVRTYNGPYLEITFPQQLDIWE